MVCMLVYTAGLACIFTSYSYIYGWSIKWSTGYHDTAAKMEGFFPGLKMMLDDGVKDFVRGRRGIIYCRSLQKSLCFCFVCVIRACYPLVRFLYPHSLMTLSFAYFLYNSLNPQLDQTHHPRSSETESTHLHHFTSLHFTSLQPHSHTKRVLRTPPPPLTPHAHHHARSRSIRLPRHGLLRQEPLRHHHHGRGLCWSLHVSGSWVVCGDGFC